MTRKQWKARKKRRYSILRQVISDLAYLMAGLVTAMMTMFLLSVLLT